MKKNKTQIHNILRLFMDNFLNIYIIVFICIFLKLYMHAPVIFQSDASSSYYIYILFITFSINFCPLHK